MDAQELVQSVAREPVDRQDRRRELPVQLGHPLARPGHGRNRDEDVVEPLQVPFHVVVMGANEETEPDHRARHQRRHPPPLGELLVEGDSEDRHAEDESGPLDRELALPPRLPSPLGDPVPGHAELGEREREEDVDRIHDDERRDVAVRVKKGRDGGETHHEDAVLRDEPVRELREAVGHPRIDRHVPEDARAVEKAGLGRDEEKRGLRDQQRQDERAPDRHAPGTPPAEESVEEDEVHRLSRLGTGSDEEVPEQDASRREGERGRHQEHRPLRGLHTGLPEHRDAVGDRLDPRVGAPAHRVRPEEDERERPEAHRRPCLREVACGPGKDRGERPGVRREDVGDRRQVRHAEDEEDRHEERDGFLHAPEVQSNEEEQDQKLGSRLVAAEVGRKKIPDLVASGRHGDRDRQDVIDEERAPRDDAGLLPEELRGHEVPAAAARKVLDEVGVGGGDDGDGHGRHRHEDDGEGVVAAEGAEGLVGAVCGGGEPVGAEADPREERDEGEPVEDAGVSDVPTLSQEELSEPVGVGQCSSRRRSPRTRVSPRRR